MSSHDDTVRPGTTGPRRTWRTSDPTTPSVVCLDMDGCIVDSTVAITRSLHEALAQLRLPPPPTARLRQLIGPPLAVGVGGLLRDLEAPPELLDPMVRAYRRAYRARMLTDTRPVEGMPAAVDELRRRHRLLLVTSKPAAFAAPILDRLGLLGAFDSVHAPHEDATGEPKADLLGRALEGLLPRRERWTRAVMVGDRHHDVDAGMACGTRTLAVTWGIGSRSELSDAAPDALVEAPADLPGAVEALVG